MPRSAIGTTATEPPPTLAEEPEEEPELETEGAEVQSSFTESIRILLPFARDGRRYYMLSALLAVGAALAQLGVYYVVYLAVAQIITTPEATANGLYRLAAIGAALVGVRILLDGSSTWISHVAAFGTLERLRLRIGEKLTRVPLGFVNRRRSGEIQRTMIDDVERLELFLAHAIPDVVSAKALIVFTTVWLFIVDWRLATATIIVVLLAMPLMGMAMKAGAANLGAYNDSLARMNGSIVEFVRGLPIIRTFNRTDDTFTETRESITAAATLQAGWGRQFLPTYSLFIVLISANGLFMMPLGLWLWSTNRVETSILLFFFIIGLGFSLPILQLMGFVANLSHLSFNTAALLKIDEASELSEKLQEVEIATPSIVVEDVSFSHIGFDEKPRKVLAECSFTAGPGTVTALVGPSGGGKSTLAALLCRFWDVDSGQISVGGHDIRDIPTAQLMDEIAFVFQETFLFDDTVAANIRFGDPDAGDARVIEAAKAARAHDFIEALPDGYDSRLGERGARLSGGERQRLAIARAFLKASPILILDEATAFADPENEAALQDALTDLAEGRTLILIAHRLSTIVGADQILVIDADDGPGRIVERGQHEDLIAAGGLYARMWEAFEAAESSSLGDAVRRGASHDD